MINLFEMTIGRTEEFYLNKHIKVLQHQVYCKPFNWSYIIRNNSYNFAERGAYFTDYELDSLVSIFYMIRFAEEFVK